MRRFPVPMLILDSRLRPSLFVPAARNRTACRSPLLPDVSLPVFLPADDDRYDRFDRILGSRAAADADGRFEVEVKVYGITQTHGFSSEYRPILGVTGRLMSAKGEKLWERYDYLTARNDSLPGRSFEEYLEDPRNMREAYEKMSEGVVSLLMENL